MSHVTALVIETHRFAVINLNRESEDTLLTALQQTVGGYVEAVSGDDWVAFLNEDGKNEGLPINRTATLLLNALKPGFAEHDFAVGTMVVLGRRGIETTDVPDDIVNRFKAVSTQS